RAWPARSDRRGAGGAPHQRPAAGHPRRACGERPDAQPRPGYARDEVGRSGVASRLAEDARRPSPEALLKSAVEEQRSRLKSFVGAGPGVGKSYPMLQAAHGRRAEGVDVVVGVVETHKRAETEALLHGLEVIPRRRVEYHGTVLEEMDV